MRATERRRLKAQLRYDHSRCVGCKESTTKTLVKDCLVCNYCGHAEPVPRSTWPECCPTCGGAWRNKSKTMGAALGQPHCGRCVNWHRWQEPEAS